ncbi:TPA: bacteriocin [Streptococcus suis]|nr:bacteriocin [Streptococcus suis]HEM4252276.1 bacteriocin [Streptococcus suis]
MKDLSKKELQNITGGSIIGLVGNIIRRPRIYLPGEPVKPKTEIM